LAYKLTERHLTVEGTGRMRVKPAAQLLSNTVAKAIYFCGEKKYIDSFNWKEASDHVMFNLILSFYYYTLFNNYILT